MSLRWLRSYDLEVKSVGALVNLGTALEARSSLSDILAASDGERTKAR
jgi:hypothetical protein